MTLKQRRVYKSFFFQLSSSSLALYSTTTVSHIPTGRLLHRKEHSALRVPAASPWWAAIPSSAQIINFTHVWFEKKKSCGAFKQLFRQTCCFRQTTYCCRKGLRAVCMDYWCIIHSLYNTWYEEHTAFIHVRFTWAFLQTTHASTRRRVFISKVSGFLN